MPPGFYHVGVVGDTLARLARTYGVATWQEIRDHERNVGLPRDTLPSAPIVGRRVWIPAKLNRVRGHTGGFFKFFRRPHPPIEEVQIATLTFGSDHGVLINNAKDYTDTRDRCTKPEWNEHGSLPISQTKNTKLKVTIGLTATPPNHASTKALVRGMSSDGAFSFVEQEVFLENGKGEATLESDESLPDKVTRITFHIHWGIEIDGKASNIGSSGEHAVFVTYGNPYGSIPTRKRLFFVTKGIDRLRSQPDRALNTESDYVNAIFDLIGAMDNGHYFLGAPYPRPVWLICSGARAECNALADFFMQCCQIIGLPDKFVLGHLFPGLEYNTGKFDRSGGANETRDVASTHVLAGQEHGSPEKLIFRDHSRRKTAFEGWNHFEGTIEYVGRYYCIGETTYGSPASAMKAMVVVTVWANEVTGFCKVPGPYPQRTWDPDAWLPMKKP
jgi:hypothetical protein